MPDDSSPNLRERQKAQTRELIVDALVAAMAAGDWEAASHEALARSAGVSRQTVYRHFPDREALMRAIWERLNPRFSPPGLPDTEAKLTELLPAMHAAFERDADLITIAQTTPQGRQVKLSVRERRAAAFRAATAAATAGLSERDAILATSVIQLLHGGQAWVEMTQQWDMTSEEVTRACDWAIRTLLSDLHARSGVPLDRPAPARRGRSA